MSSLTSYEHLSSGSRRSIRKNIGGGFGTNTTTKSAWRKFEAGEEIIALLDDGGNMELFQHGKDHTFNESLFRRVYNKVFFTKEDSHVYIIKGPSTSDKIQWFAMNFGGVFTQDPCRVSNPLTLAFESIAGTLYHWVDNPTDQNFQNFIGSLNFGENMFKDIIKNPKEWGKTIYIIERYLNDNNIENVLAYIAGSSLYSFVTESSNLPNVSRNRIFSLAMISLSRTFVRFGTDITNENVLKCILPIIVSIKLMNGEDFQNLISNTVGKIVSDNITNIPAVVEHILKLCFPITADIEVAKVASVVCQMLQGPKKLQYVDKVWNDILSNIEGPVILNNTIFEAVKKVGQEFIGASFDSNSGEFAQSNTKMWGCAGCRFFPDYEVLNVYCSGMEGFHNDGNPGIRFFANDTYHKPMGKLALSTNGGIGTGRGKPTRVPGSSKLNLDRFDNSLIAKIFKSPTSSKLRINITGWNGSYDLPGNGSYVNLGFKGCKVRFEIKEKNEGGESKSYDGAASVPSSLRTSSVPTSLKSFSSSSSNTTAAQLSKDLKKKELEEIRERIRNLESQ